MTQKGPADLAESFVVCVYGASGVGKTTCMGYSFPEALFIAAPGALHSIKSVCGYEPKRAFVSTIAQATTLIEDASKKYRFVVIDDFSFMAEQSFSVLEAKFSGSNNPYKVWGKLRDEVLAFRDKSRYCGVNVAITCWEQPPKKNAKGAAIRGGPKLSGNLPEAVPALCDVVARGVHEPKRRPWPAVYRCFLDGSWTLKDRFDIITRCDPAPMNMGELLRAAGHDIPRHPDMTKQEDRVESISAAFSGDDKADIEFANKIYQQLIEKGVSIPETRWTLRDAMDRATIHRALDQSNSVFIQSANSAILL